jgi:nucleoid-associated protein YgaU
MWTRKWWLIVVGCICVVAYGQQASVKPEHPDRYVVKQGDTLWDIAGRFLDQPWRWRQIWRANPQISNPDRIYPGDVLVLRQGAAGPYVEVERGLPEVRLSPQVQVIPLPRPIPTIPLDVVKPFLIQPLVVSRAELNRAAYVVANADERLVVGTADRVYVRGIDEFEGSQYAVFRPGKVFRDPVSGELLGYEAVHIAEGQLLGSDGVATLALTNASEAVHPGDRVLPAEEAPPDMAFLPRAPEAPVEGQVISLADGSPHVGRYAVVVINLGEGDGVHVGDVLAVRQAGRVIDDPVRGGRVKLPEERAGLVMLFRVFDRVSYGLVMQAVRDISVHDVVGNPE